MENNLNKKGNGLALLPLLMFIGIYLGSGIYCTVKGVENAFYQFPAAASAIIGIVVAFAITKGPVSERFSIFLKGITLPDVQIMLIIYLLAGAFSGVATAMGGRDAVVNMGLSLIPPRFLTAGVFIISAFIGTVTGSSMGTVSAVVPVAVGLANAGGLNVSLVLGACLGGAMFGDNLSMISDTTIAATRSQGVEMRDKFRVNFWIAFPAAVITVVLLVLFGQPETVVPIADASFSILKVLPYIAVLAMALIGCDVYIVLLAGLVAASVIGIATGSLNVFEVAQSAWSGFTSMDEVFYLTFLCAGMAELISYNGGVHWILQRMQFIMKGNKSSQIGIAALVSVLDCAVANNTVAIILAGPIAKEISHEHKIDPRRTASLMDVFSCVFQGIIPYGGQMLVTVGMAVAYGASVSAVDVIGKLWYILFLTIFGILSVFVPFADGVCRKDPWNWDHNCAESKLVGTEAQLHRD